MQQRALQTDAIETESCINRLPKRQTTVQIHMYVTVQAETVKLFSYRQNAVQSGYYGDCCADLSSREKIKLVAIEQKSSADSYHV